MFTLFVSVGFVTTKEACVRVLSRPMPGPVPRVGDSIVLNRRGDLDVCETVEVGQVQRVYGAAGGGIPGLCPTEIRVVASGIRAKNLAEVEETVAIFRREHDFTVDEVTTTRAQVEAEKTSKAARDAFAAMKGVMEGIGGFAVHRDDCPDCGPACDEKDGCCKDPKLN